MILVDIGLLPIHPHLRSTVGSVSNVSFSRKENFPLEKAFAVQLQIAAPSNIMLHPWIRRTNTHTHIHTHRLLQA